MSSSDHTDLTAARFVERLKAHARAGDDRITGVPARQVFALAKEFIDMPLPEIERLLESPVEDVRLGAVSVMDFQARRKSTPEDRRRELYELYLRRHDRIDGWGLVDRAAPHVVGGYLFDKPRDVLYWLARSKSVWERRTAIVSTYYFIRQGQVDDTFRIAEMLVEDEHNLIHTAVGGWMREAGKKDPQRLLAFLDEHAATMPRIALRFAIEHLSAAQRGHYLGMKKAGTPPKPRVRP